MSRRALLLPGLAVLLLALLAVLFGVLFERREVEEEVGASREVRRNPYFASARLLERMGHAVVTLDGIGHLDVLPPTQALLMAPSSRRTLTRERQQALLDWVEAGGQLLVVTHTLWDEAERRPDWLLDRFGLRQYRHEPPDEEIDEPEAEAAGEGADAAAEFPGSEAQAVARDVTSLHWPGLDEPLEVHFERDWYWIDGFDDAELYARGDGGIHLILLRHGAGRLIALTDDLFLRNDSVGEADHAELVVRLARLAGPDAPVWIAVGESWPGLWRRAAAHAAPALLALALALTAWIWRAARRFGPLYPAPELARRRWMEHLDAVGRFHWRADRGHSLLAATRSSVLRALGRRRPAFARLAPPARNQALARLTGLTAHKVSLALDAEFQPAGEAAFVTAVARLERIRSQL